MTALRCTAKLLKVLKARPIPEAAAPGNRLGEWTANLIRIGRIQLVLAVNERTRLGVAVDAAPYKDIPGRLAFAIRRSLTELGIPEADAHEEVMSMQPLEICATNSRSVLATLSRYAWDIEVWMHYGDVDSAHAISRRLLDEIVVDPKHIGRPADRVRETFGLPPVRYRRPGEAANDPD
jgi:hypothetical protein